MPVSDKQKRILAFPYTKYDALIADGAIRTGKTSLMVVSFIDWAMKNFNRQRFAFCGKTVDSCVKNLIQPYLNMTYHREKYSVQWRRTDKLLVVSCNGKENIFEVFGGKDESSYALIQGRTLAGVLLDEVALMPRSFVEQACARCSVDGSKLWFNCNPGSPQHWFYTEWIKGANERNALHLHFTLDDNPALSDKIVERYKAMYSGVFYDRYILGKWVAAEGLVYPDFANNTDKYVIADIDKWKSENKTHFSTVMIGVDYGGTGSATKYQATGITPKGVVVAIDEEYITGEIDPDGLNKSYSAFVRRLTDKYGFAQTRADSAEQILIRGFKHTAERDGLKTQVKNAIKMPINDRIMLELLLMKQGRLFVSKDCPHLIEAFQTACYDPKSFDDVRLDDGTSDIDSLDAFEYSIEPYYKQLEKYGFMR